MSSEMDSGCSSAEDGKVEVEVDGEKGSEVDEIPSSGHDDDVGPNGQLFGASASDSNSDANFEENGFKCTCSESDGDSKDDIDDIREHILRSLDFDNENDDDGVGWDTMESLDMDLDEAEEDALTFIPFPPNFAQHMEQMRRRVEEANRIWDAFEVDENDEGEEKVDEENGAISSRRKVTFKNESDLVDTFVFERDESELELTPRPISLLALQNEVSKYNPEADFDDFEERILKNLSFIAIGTAIKKPGQCGDGHSYLNEETDDDDTSVDDYICSCSTTDLGQNLEPSASDDDSSYQSSVNQNDQKTTESSALIRTIFNYQNIQLLKNLKKRGGAAAEVKKHIEQYGITKDMLKSIFNEKFLQSIYDGKLKKSYKNYIRPPTAPSRAQQGQYLRSKSGQIHGQEVQDFQQKMNNKDSITNYTNYANERPKSAKMNSSNYSSTTVSPAFSNVDAAGDGFIFLRPSSSPAHLNSPRIVQKLSKSSSEDQKVHQVKKSHQNQKKPKDLIEKPPKLNHQNKVKNKGTTTSSSGKNTTEGQEKEKKASEKAFEKWLDKKRKAKPVLLANSSMPMNMTKKIFHPNLVLLANKYVTNGGYHMKKIQSLCGATSPGQSGQSQAMKKVNNNANNNKIKKSSSTEQIPCVDRGFTNIKINGPSTRLMTINPRLIDTYNVYRYGGPASTLDSKIIKNYRYNFQYNL